MFNKIAGWLTILLALPLISLQAQVTSSRPGFINGYLTAKGIYWGDSLDMYLPRTDGTTGQVLSTDGSGAVSWMTSSVSGDTIISGTDSLFVGKTISDTANVLRAFLVDTTEVKARVDTTRFKADSTKLDSLYTKIRLDSLRVVDLNFSRATYSNNIWTIPNDANKAAPAYMYGGLGWGVPGSDSSGVSRDSLTGRVVMALDGSAGDSAIVALPTTIDSTSSLDIEVNYAPLILDNSWRYVIVGRLDTGYVNVSSNWTVQLQQRPDSIQIRTITPAGVETIAKRAGVYFTLRKLISYRLTRLDSVVVLRVNGDSVLACTIGGGGNLRRTNRVRVGQLHQTGSTKTAGAVGNFSVYTRALSSSERTVLYNNSLRGIQPPGPSMGTVSTYYKAGDFMSITGYGDSAVVSCLVDTAGNTTPSTVADMIEDSLNTNMRPQAQAWAGDSAWAIAPEVVEDSLVEVRTLIQDVVEDSLVEVRALVYTVVSDTSATMRTYVQDVVEDSLVEVRALIYTVVTDTATSLRTYAETVAGDSATAHCNDALAMVRDTVGVIITDSSLVNRTELNDSITAVEGRVLTASTIKDSLNRLEADIRDTVLVVVGGFIIDSLAALRQEMKDSSAAVVGDSLSANYLSAAVSRGEMSDTALAHANLVRGELRDSATVVWNDSSIVIIRMAEFVDSLTALEDRIAADSLAVLRAEMPDSAARVVADSAATMRTYVQDTVEDSLVEVRTYAETVAGDSATAISAEVVEDSLVEVRAQIYTVVSDTAGAMRTYVQDVVEDSLVEIRTEIASKLDTSDIAVAGGATKGWNGTTLTITAASNSGISDSLARADSTHNTVLRPAIATDSTWSGTVYRGIAGATTTWGQTLYMKSDGKLYAAKADSVLTMPVIGMALNGAAANGALLVLAEGFVCDTSYSWTPGARVYASSATAGALSTSVVSTAAHVSQILGIGWAADVLYFKPSLVEAVK